MFKIDEEGKIKISRRNSGQFNLVLPISDSNGYIKYKDESNNIYWYDDENNILYDSNYVVSTLNVNWLEIVNQTYEINDIITMNIYEKNGYDKEPVHIITTNILQESESATIQIETTDTDFAESTNKKIVYWYDISVNGNTVVGFDDDGPKEFIIYPAKGVETNYE